ncbi:DUF3515 family protein [Cellulomonas sp. URHE0023]|uniref:DUF3515 family protein n=1 Tax=Cellulomonas sp. URHE0023 TaxID=1380354 RepID=UPI00068B0C26|nr:DUF3515 family protein [Cellulomonas sp. URHE0023]
MRNRRLATPAAVVATLLLLAGCTSAVAAEAAPHATDPVCASVVLAMPDSLGDDLPRRDTTAQATAAWGDPEAPILLRCGVEPLGPTTEHCQTVETPGGPSIDWVTVENDDGSWTLTTYGRSPAVEVDVPATVAASTGTSYVDQLGAAVAMTAQQRTCL